MVSELSRPARRAALTRSGGNQAATKAARLGWVDTGRGLAILLVVLYHASEWLNNTGHSVWVDASVIVSSLRMPMFFVFAGLFAGKWVAADWSALLRAKLLLFGWVFIVWETISSGTFMLAMLATHQPVGVTATIKLLLLSPILPRYELWFIWALALFFVVAKVTRRMPVGLQLAAAGILSALGLWVWLDTTTGLTGAAKFYFFFLGGLYLRNWVLAFGQKPWQWLISAFTGWLVISGTVAVLGLRDIPGLYFFNCVVGVLGGVAISRALTRVRFLGRIGQQTLPIYVTHTPIIETVLFLMMVMRIAGPVERISQVLPPIVVCLAAVGSLMLYRWASSRSAARYLYTPPLTLYDRLVRALSGSRVPTERVL